MKRRDFLKLGVGSVAVATVVANEAASKTAAPTPSAEPLIAEPAAVKSVIAEPPADHDWSVEFNSVTAQITKDTYDSFFNDGQQNHTPENFLDYLLSGTSVPHCERVSGMKCGDNQEIMRVTLTGVVFASNTGHCPVNFFSGYEHARFCLSSPNSKSGTHLTFSERIA